MKLCNFNDRIDHSLFLIAGSCVVDFEQLVLDMAGYLQDITQVNEVAQALWDIKNVITKAPEVGNEHVTLCDRGTSCDYNTLF